MIAIALEVDISSCSWVVLTVGRVLDWAVHCSGVLLSIVAK